MAREVADVTQIVPSWAAGGSDDAAYFMRRMHERGKPACYFIVGSSLAAGHHATRFEFQEQDLAIGVQMYMGPLEKDRPPRRRLTLGARLISVEC